MSEAPAPTVPNGLASLTEKRARRTMPPPRHPSKPITPKDVGGEQSPSTAAVLSRADAALPAPVPERRQVPDPQPAAAEPSVSSVPARPATVYLDESQVDFLEQARVAGLLSSPRLDLSKSAVVRLALRRLQEQLSVDEICTILRSQPIDPMKTGRKKR